MNPWYNTFNLSYGENIILEVSEDEEKEDSNPTSEIVDIPALPISEENGDDSYDEDEMDEDEEDYDFDEDEIEIEEEEGADL